MKDLPPIDKGKREGVNMPYISAYDATETYFPNTRNESVFDPRTLISSHFSPAEINRIYDNLEGTYPKRVPIFTRAPETKLVLQYDLSTDSVAKIIETDKAMADTLGKVFAEIEPNLTIDVRGNGMQLQIPIAGMSSQQIINVCNQLIDNGLEIANYEEVSLYLLSRTQTPSARDILAPDGSINLTPNDICEKLHPNNGVIKETPEQVNMFGVFSAQGIVVENSQQHDIVRGILQDYVNEREGNTPPEKTDGSINTDDRGDNIGDNDGEL